MNEQDEKILELYLKDARKKKIFFLVIAIFLISSVLFYGFYAKYKQSSNDIENFIQKETETNIINENTTNEENTNNADNTTVEENTEKQDKVDEKPKENTNKEAKEENKKQETKEKTKENAQTTAASSENKEKNTKEKPANKDFLFTDGYTMDNVTQVAQDYLKSYDFSGECVPIKDNEGVYLGMRVIFY